MSSRRRLCGTANAGSGGADPVAIKPIGSAALGHARTDRFVETVQLEHQNARSHGNRPTRGAPCAPIAIDAALEFNGEWHDKQVIEHEKDHGDDLRQILIQGHHGLDYAASGGECHPKGFNGASAGAVVSRMRAVDWFRARRGLRLPYCFSNSAYCSGVIWGRRWMNATAALSSASACVPPNDGMPVMRMPFLTIQKSSGAVHRPTVSAR